MPLRVQSNMIVGVLCFCKVPDTLTYFLLGVGLFFFLLIVRGVIHTMKTSVKSCSYECNALLI